ncbi:MAG: aminopeptidase [Spirochaetota bacterium]
MRDQRLKKLAEVLVHYSVAVKPGDFVLVSCQDIAVPWMVEVTEAAIKAGAHVETFIHSPDVDETLLRFGSEQQLIASRYLRETMMKRADVWLSAWGNRNTRAKTNILPEKMKLFSQGNASWHRIYFDRIADGSLRWCGTQFPTEADAQEASMSLREYEDFVYCAGLLDKDDPVTEWRRIRDEQNRWVHYLNKRKELHIISRGTDIRVGIGGRKWINCAGNENFPDGELFTAPIKEEVNGCIAFSFPGIYMEREVEDICLEVKDGKIVTATAKKGEDFLLSILATDNGSAFFGEVALGTNYGIQKFTRNMLFDEKIGGTIHFALGEAPKETGGINESAIHWDLLCNMKDEGKIYADGELFYENGKFIEAVLSE